MQKFADLLRKLAIRPDRANHFALLVIGTCLMAVVGFSPLVQVLVGSASAVAKDVVLDKILKKGTFSYADIAWGVYGVVAVVAPQLV